MNIRQSLIQTIKPSWIKFQSKFRSGFLSLKKRWAILAVAGWTALAVLTLVFSFQGDSIEPSLWVGWLQVTTAAIAFIYLVKALQAANETLDAQRKQFEVLTTPSKLSLSFSRDSSYPLNFYHITVDASAGVGPIHDFTLMLKFEHPIASTSVLKLGSSSPSSVINPGTQTTTTSGYMQPIVGMNIVTGAKNVALGSVHFAPTSKTVYAWDRAWGLFGTGWQSNGIFSVTVI